MFRSLRTRIAATFTAAIALLLFVVSGALIFGEWREASRSVDASLREALIGERRRPASARRALGDHDGGGLRCDDRAIAWLVEPVPPPTLSAAWASPGSA